MIQKISQLFRVFQIFFLMMCAYLLTGCGPGLDTSSTYSYCKDGNVGIAGGSSTDNITLSTLKAAQSFTICSQFEVSSISILATLWAGTGCTMTASLSPETLGASPVGSFSAVSWTGSSGEATRTFSSNSGQLKLKQGRYWLIVLLGGSGGCSFDWKKTATIEKNWIGALFDGSSWTEETYSYIFNINGQN